MFGISISGTLRIKHVFSLPVVVCWPNGFNHSPLCVQTPQMVKELQTKLDRASLKGLWVPEEKIHRKLINTFKYVDSYKEKEELGLFSPTPKDKTRTSDDQL